MNIIEINKQTLFNLYEQFPESFKGLTLNGNNLVYQGNEIDISNFNINDLLSTESSFASSLSVLSPEDIFKIIRLHALKIESDTKTTTKSETAKKIETIKEENPLMQNISIVTRARNGRTEEFIMIVDSTGQDHLFKNDRDVDLFAIYESLKRTTSNSNITPDELITAINRRLHQVSLTDYRDMRNNSKTTEEFMQKMERVNHPYRDDSTHRVYGNEEQDIAVITAPSTKEHQVVTFDHNKFGDLVVENHNQNVSGTDTSLMKDNTTASLSFTSEINNKTEVEIKSNTEEQIVARLLPSSEFYRLINSPNELTERETRDVGLFYAYIGDLMIYEDYLLSDLQAMLNEFRGFIYDLEFGERETELNAKQAAAINKTYELAEKKNNRISSETLESINAEVKKLEKIKETSRANSTGSISTIQVIAFIVGISIILTAITLYLIG